MTTSSTPSFGAVIQQIAEYRLAQDLPWREMAALMKRLTGLSIQERTLRYVIMNEGDTLPLDRTRYKLTRFAEALAGPPPRRRGSAARSSVETQP